jgi:hypothetical protein
MCESSHCAPESAAALSCAGASAHAAAPAAIAINTAIPIRMLDLRSPFTLGES